MNILLGFYFGHLVTVHWGPWAIPLIEMSFVLFIHWMLWGVDYSPLTCVYWLPLWVWDVWFALSLSSLCCCSDSIICCFVIRVFIGIGCAVAIIVVDWEILIELRVLQSTCVCQAISVTSTSPACYLFRFCIILCVAHCSGYYSAFKMCFANVLCDTLPDANNGFVWVRVRVNVVRTVLLILSAIPNVSYQLAIKQ